MLKMIKTMVIDEFGRIDGLVLKTAIEKGAIVIAENYPVIPINYMVYMFKYDSINDNIKNKVCEIEQSLYANGNKITVFDGRDPVKIDWSSADRVLLAPKKGVRMRTSLPLLQLLRCFVMGTNLLMPRLKSSFQKLLLN